MHNCPPLKSTYNNWLPSAIEWGKVVETDNHFLEARPNKIPMHFFVKLHMFIDAEGVPETDRSTDAGIRD